MSPSIVFVMVILLTLTLSPPHYLVSSLVAMLILGLLTKDTLWSRPQDTIWPFPQDEFYQLDD